jgi:hypothetical protein
VADEDEPAVAERGEDGVREEGQEKGDSKVLHRPTGLRRTGGSCHLRPRCGLGRWSEPEGLAEPVEAGQLFSKGQESPGDCDPLNQ